MDKLERWLSGTESGFLFKAPDARRTGERRVYILDADEEDGKRCETCEHYVNNCGLSECDHANNEHPDSGDDFVPYDKNFCCSYWTKREKE